MNVNVFDAMSYDLANDHMVYRMYNETRKCNSCNNEKFLNKFYGRIVKQDKKLIVSFRKICKDCLKHVNVNNVKKARKNNNLHILSSNIRQKSLKYGKKSNLKVKDIEMILSCPCYFCKSKESKITVGRKQVNDGFTLENSIPCCARCESIRSDMPFEAWKNLLPIVINTNKLGLFGDWKT